MSGHHSCMQMLQLFDIPNMEGLQGTLIQKVSKSPGIKKNQFPEKYKIYVKLTYLISRIFCLISRIFSIFWPSMMPPQTTIALSRSRWL